MNNKTIPFDADAEYKINVYIAVALIQNLFNNGMIKKSTYEAVVKDSQKMIDKCKKIC